MFVLYVGVWYSIACYSVGCGAGKEQGSNVMCVMPVLCCLEPLTMICDSTNETGTVSNSTSDQKLFFFFSRVPAQSQLKLQKRTADKTSVVAVVQL